MGRGNPHIHHQGFKNCWWFTDKDKGDLTASLGGGAARREHSAVKPDSWTAVCLWSSQSSYCYCSHLLTYKAFKHLLPFSKVFKGQNFILFMLRHIGAKYWVKSCQMWMLSFPHCFCESSARHLRILSLRSVWLLFIVIDWLQRERSVWSTQAYLSSWFWRASLGDHYHNQPHLHCQHQQWYHHNIIDHCYHCYHI